jgi:transposase
MTALNLETIALLLNLPSIKVESFEIINNEIFIRVCAIDNKTHCHKCGKEVNKYYAKGQEIKLRHLPLFGYAVYIIITPNRYCCDNCPDRTTTTQKFSWYREKAKTTKMYENHILLNLVNSTIADVSQKENISYAVIENIVDKNIASEINWDEIEDLNCIGIDEISLKKGHKDFVTVISAFVDKKLTVIALLKKRTKEAVKEFFCSIPKRLRETVNIICSDLYKGFINAAKEVFGKRIKVVADRFHVAKLYREGLETLRKSEMKRLKNELSKEAYAGLKTSMWLLRKSPSDITSDEKRILKKLFNYSPKLKIAYELMNKLTAIYNAPISKGLAKIRIKGWMRQVKNKAATCFNRFLKTLEINMEEITNYFINRDNSGFVEGLNNKIKVIKRRCYGITNIRHLFQRLFLDLHGYNLLKFQ